MKSGIMKKSLNKYVFIIHNEIEDRDKAVWLNGKSKLVSQLGL